MSDKMIILKYYPEDCLQPNGEIIKDSKEMCMIVNRENLMLIETDKIKWEEGVKTGAGTGKNDKWMICYVLPMNSNQKILINESIKDFYNMYM